MTDAKFERVTVYVDKQKYRKFKAALMLRGLTVSEWARREIDRIVEQQKETLLPYERKD